MPDSSPSVSWTMLGIIAGAFIAALQFGGIQEKVLNAERDITATKSVAEKIADQNTELRERVSRLEAEIKR